MDEQSKFERLATKQLIGLAIEQAELIADMRRMFPGAPTNPLQGSFLEITRARSEIVNLARNMGMDVDALEEPMKRAYQERLAALNEIQEQSKEAKRLARELRERT